MFPDIYRRIDHVFNQSDHRPPKKPGPEAQSGFEPALLTFAAVAWELRP
jgi:hypothetical protein